MSLEENEAQNPEEEKNLDAEKASPEKGSAVKSKIALRVHALKVASILMSKVLWQAFLFLLVAVALNVGVYILSDQQVSYLLDSREVSFVGKIGGYVFIISIFFLFPLFFVLAGLRRGILVALYYLVSKTQEVVFTLFFTKFFDYVMKKPVLKEKLEYNLVNSLAGETLPNYLVQLPNMNFVFRGIYRRIAKHIDFKALLLKHADEQGGRLDIEIFKNQLATQAATQIPQKLLGKPGWWPLYICIIINIVWAVAFRFLVG